MSEEFVHTPHQSAQEQRYKQYSALLALGTVDCSCKLLINSKAGTMALVPAKESENLLRFQEREMLYSFLMSCLSSISSLRWLRTPFSSLYYINVICCVSVTRVFAEINSTNGKRKSISQMIFSHFPTHPSLLLWGDSTQALKPGSQAVFVSPSINGFWWWKKSYFLSSIRGVNGQLW